MRTRPTSSPTFASLFSGCGGFDIGFANVGYSPSAAFDIDQAIINNYNENLRPVAHRCDLSKEVPLPLLEQADVLLAGSPCQGFSTVGKRIVSDPRNRLASRAGQIARAIRPKVFILENVPAALSGQHAQHWEEVECGLKADGYNVRRFICEGKHSGVAQKRRRLFLIAWLGSDCIRIEPDAAPSISLADALSGVEDLPDHDPEFLIPGSKDYLIAQSIRQGQKLCNVRAASTAVHTWDIPAAFGVVTQPERNVLEALVSLRRRNRRRDFGDADPVNVSDLSLHLERDVSANVQSLLTKDYIRMVAPGVIDLRHTFNGKYRRLSLADNSPTVDTRFGDHRLFLHPTEHRPLTTREAARIQGFPDSYRFVGSRQKKYTMIGNAVPPPMAQRLATFVRKALL